MLSVSSQRKYNFYNQNTLLDGFRTNSRNIIGRNPAMVIPLLANQDLMPMLSVLVDKGVPCKIPSESHAMRELRKHIQVCGLDYQDSS